MSSPKDVGLKDVSLKDVMVPYFKALTMLNVAYFQCDR